VPQRYGPKLRSAVASMGLQVGELVARRGEQAGLGPHARARAEAGRLEAADREREQVGGDRLREREAVHDLAFGTCLGGQLLGGHDGAQAGRGGDAGAEGDADAGAVLDRDPRARVDRLRLAVEEGGGAVVGLGRGEPLQAGRRGRGPVADADDVGVALGQVHGERTAEDRVGAAEGPRDRAPAGGVVDVGVAGDVHAEDLEVAGVEHELAGPGGAGDRQHHRAGQDLALEVDGEVEAEVTDEGLGGAGERVGVGAGEPRGQLRDGGGRGVRLGGRRGRHAGGQERDEEDRAERQAAPVYAAGDAGARRNGRVGRGGSATHWSATQKGQVGRPGPLVGDSGPSGPRSYSRLNRRSSCMKSRTTEENSESEAATYASGW
jgi:hypothetical protein